MGESRRAAEGFDGQLLSLSAEDGFSSGRHNFSVGIEKILLQVTDFCGKRLMGDRKVNSRP